MSKEVSDKHSSLANDCASGQGPEMNFVSIDEQLFFLMQKYSLTRPNISKMSIFNFLALLK